MTDLEIDKALAMAIGWKRILPNPEVDGIQQCWVCTGHSWRVFSHKDWNIIGPIADRYNCFPKILTDGYWSGGLYSYAKTPQKAIALAVINAKK